MSKRLPKSEVIAAAKQPSNIAEVDRGEPYTVTAPAADPGIRGMLTLCQVCRGKDSACCNGCNGAGMVPHDHALFLASAALKQAALNYAAATLLSHATVDIVDQAFQKLEEASARYQEVKK